MPGIKRSQWGELLKIAEECEEIDPPDWLR